MNYQMRYSRPFVDVGLAAVGELAFDGGRKQRPESAAAPQCRNCAGRRAAGHAA